MAGDTRPPGVTRARTSTPRSELERIAWPELGEEVRATLRRAGVRRELADGEVLFEVGQPDYDLFLIERGTVLVVDRADDHVVVSVREPNFLGELGMLMGQGTFLAAIAQGPVVAWVVSRGRLLELIAAVPEVGDAVVSAFAARRRLLIEWSEGGLAIVGREEDPATVRLLEFAGRNRIAYRLVSPDDPEAVRQVLGPAAVSAEVLETGPVVVTRDKRRLEQPQPRDLARALGMELGLNEDAVFDLLVVGAGPAGLATALYGASEGLSTLVVEDTAIGGQAGTSSRIENYLGFATGVSGSELAYQGQIQAIKFGARLTVPRRAVRLTPGEAHHELGLDDGSVARGRALVLACGVQYRRLPLARLEDLEGAGVYYAATELEARFCRGTDAVIVGGGNSAGQAAMFLSRHARCTHVVVRGSGLAATMSSYLSGRIAGDPRIRMHTRSEVAALHGGDRLEAIDLRDVETGEATRIATGALFIMIGAAPNTDWLRGAIELDDKGFVRTGQDGEPFATSRAGVFAVGDVRAGSVKRVAAAVGEGSVAVAGVHRFLDGGADRPRADRSRRR